MSRVDSSDVLATRSKALKVGVLTSILQRGVGALVPLLSVPIALDHLGYENYGAWAVAVSLTTIIAFSDLGIGAGLMTRLGRGSGDADSRESDRVLISSAYALVGVIALVMLGVLLACAAAIDVGHAFTGESTSDIEFIVVATLSAFLIGVPVSLIVRVQFALGQQVSSNLWQVTGSLAMLAGMWLTARYTTWPGWFVLVTAGVPVAVAVANSVWFYRFSAGRGISPTVMGVALGSVSILVKLGVRFLLIGLLMAAALAGDPWIVAHTASLSDVADFTIPYRLLSVVGLISVMALMPLWPLHARAVEEGNTSWISRTTWRLAGASGAAMVVIVALVVVFSDLLVDVWLDGAIEVDRSLWIGFGFVCVIQAVLGPFFMVQNGAEVLVPQTISYALLLAVVPVKWWLADSVGYESLPWVTAVGYLLIVVPGCLVGYRKALAVAESRLAGGQQ